MIWVVYFVFSFFIHENIKANFDILNDTISSSTLDALILRPKTSYEIPPNSIALLVSERLLWALGVQNFFSIAWILVP